MGAFGIAVDKIGIEILLHFGDTFIPLAAAHDAEVLIEQGTRQQRQSVDETKITPRNSGTYLAQLYQPSGCFGSSLPSLVLKSAILPSQISAQAHRSGSDQLSSECVWASWLVRICEGVVFTKSHIGP